MDFTDQTEDKRKQQFGIAPPTLGSGLAGMSRTVSDLGLSPPSAAVAVPGAPGVTKTVGADGGLTYSGQGIPAPDNSPARSAMDTYRSEAAIRGLDPNTFDRVRGGPTGTNFKFSSISDTVAGDNGMPSGLSARQQANFLGQQQQTQAILRGQDLNHEAALSGQDVQSRGQNLNFQATLAGQGIQARGQDLSAQAQERSYGLENQRLGLAQTAEQRANEQFGLQRPILEGQASDAKGIRTAREGLQAAISSGDPAAIAKAREVAVAAGIKFDRPNNEFTTTTDSMGLNVTRTNKDTGAVDIIDPKTGEVKSIQAPGQAQKLPPGMVKQVGTSGGVPVYEDANGKRFLGGN